MKYLILVILFLYSSYVKSQQNTYDSVVVYTIPFYSLTHNRIDKSSIPFYGDTTKIYDSKVVETLFSNLQNVLSRTPQRKLKKIRKEYTTSSIDYRALFIFYKNGNETTIGVSAQNLITLNNNIFIGGNKIFERVILSSYKKLHKLLFSTEVITSYGQ